MSDHAEPNIDVFLSHSHTDAVWVEALAGRLVDERGCTVWLDRWQLVPGREWQQEMARGLDQANCCAVFINGDTPQGWFNQEIQRALQRQVQDQTFRVIPVLLPTAPRDIDLGFLGLRTWVDFREGADEEYALHVLVQGIRGEPIGRWPIRQVPVEPELVEHEQRIIALRRLGELGLHDEVVIEFERKILNRWFEEA